MSDDQPSPGNGESKRTSPASEPPPAPERPELSAEVKGWLPYCGVPCTVQLRTPLVLMDCQEVVRIPVDEHGNTRPHGVAGPAVFRQVVSDEDGENHVVERGQVTDTVDRVMMQPAICGRRLLLVRRMDDPGQSGALIGYVVNPAEVVAISQVIGVPESRVAAADGPRIHLPG